jgi:ATP-dependent RNA helicase DeaD
MPSNNTPTLPFDALGLPTELLDSLSRLGYETATPIQSQAIPALLEGRDVVGIAQDRYR